MGIFLLTFVPQICINQPLKTEIMEQLKKKTTPTSFYLADGNYDTDGNLEINVFLTQHDNKNPFVFGPFYNISKRNASDPNEDINGIIIFVQKADDNGIQLSGSGNVHTKRILKEDIITYPGNDNFDPSKNDSLLVVYHTNEFNYNDVHDLYNDLKQHYNNDIGTVIDMNHPFIPKKAGMSLIVKRPVV